MRHIALLCCALFASPAAAAPVPVGGDPVLYWNEVFLSTTSGPPPIRERVSAIVNVAMYEAVNAAQGAPNRSYLGFNGATGDVRAAASVAAHNVFVSLNQGQTSTYDNALAASLALIPDSAAKTAGIATGVAAAAAALANRANDGSGAVVPYTPTGQPGHWASTGSAAILTQWGAVTPFVVTSATQFLAPTPPALDSVAYANAFNEVKDIGSATSLTRLPDQGAAANFWAGSNMPWTRAAIDAAATSGQSTLQNASLMTLLAISDTDTFVTTFNTKYFYDLWRPVTAIRNADIDGNLLTTADPAWSALIANPSYPGYVSGFSAYSGSGATVLSSVFGDSHSFCLTVNAAERCWNGFQTAAEEAANSRLWGGIHFRFDNDAGLAEGRSIANYILSQNLLGAVPEPAAWMTMIMGFGLIGAVLRLRSKSLALAS